MRLPKTNAENSFDINFCIFIFCQLYILLDFTHLLVVSGILTLFSLFICLCGCIYVVELKREDPDRKIFIDISKNIFLPLVLCITWLVLYDAYSYFTDDPLHAS